MKSLGRLILPALAWLMALSAVSAKSIVTDIAPPKSGKVTADRVNVRARASLIGERVTQLRKDDTVTVTVTVSGVSIHRVVVENPPGPAPAPRKRESEK